MFIFSCENRFFFAKKKTSEFVYLADVNMAEFAFLAYYKDYPTDKAIRNQTVRKPLNNKHENLL